MLRRKYTDGLPTGPGTIMQACNNDVALVRRVQAAVLKEEKTMRDGLPAYVPDEALAAVRGNTPPDRLLLAAMAAAIGEALLAGFEPWGDGTRPPLWRDALVALVAPSATEEDRDRLEDTVRALFAAAVDLAVDGVMTDVDEDFVGTVFSLALREGTS